MGLIDHLRDYGLHPDPTTAACNRIALLVAINQPIYPFYLLWLVGGDWLTSCWTFLSTPMFAAVPALARRHSVAGRALCRRPASSMGSSAPRHSATPRVSNISLSSAR
jgi:hypothetical protein